MKTVQITLSAFVMICSLALHAQNKNEMPFSTSPENNKLLRQAWTLFGDIKLADGSKLGQQVIDNDPSCGIAYISIVAADAEIRKQNFTKAEAGKLSPDEKLLVDGIKANDANVEGKPSSDFFNQLLKKYPKDDYLQIIMLFNTRDVKWRVQTAEALTKRNPKFAPAYNLLGYAYMNLNDMPKAEAAFNKYVSLRPELANVYDSKADYFMRVENFKEAASLYEKAASMGMTDSKIRAMRAAGREKCPSLTAEEKEGIKKLIANSSAEIVSGNLNPFLAYYSDQAIEVFSNQIVNVGKPNLTRRLTNDLNNGAFTKNDITVESVDGMGQIAFARGTYAGGYKPKDGEVQEDKGNVIFLFRKQMDGTWKIIADHYYEDTSTEAPPADVASIRQVITSWNNMAKPGEVMTSKNIDALGNLYSGQAIEIFPGLRTNIGIANLKTRWGTFADGAKLEYNSLGPVKVEVMGHRGYAWGMCVQRIYPKGSDKMTESVFPWAMIFTKEKDDVWRILVVHWYNN